MIQNIIFCDLFDRVTILGLTNLSFIIMNLMTDNISINKGINGLNRFMKTCIQNNNRKVIMFDECKISGSAK